MNIVYPLRCPVCGRILKDSRYSVCPGCPSKLHPATKDFCLKCGRPVSDREELCRDCTRHDRSFSRGRSVYIYDDIMQKSLIRFKKQGDRTLSRFYAEAAAYYLKEEFEVWDPDILVPIPLSRRSFRGRGFNQAADLADGIGERLGIPVDNGLLIKVRETKPQKELDADLRKQNLRGAFAVTRRIDGMKIVLIDDVYTTGSTMDTAAKCLREAGAADVWFAALCTVRI